MKLPFAFTASLAAAFIAAGQCVPSWIPGDSLNGSNGRVVATTTWDPDGTGPEGPRIVMTGDFTVAGNAKSTNLAAYNPATGGWTPLVNQPVNGFIETVVALPNGDLIIGGTFTSIDGVAVSNIGIRRGSVWSDMAGGVDNSVSSISVAPSGDVYVGGWFSTAGGVAARLLARWDGLAWHAIGGPFAQMTSGSVHTVLARENGHVLVYGNFVGTYSFPSLQYWNGSEWTTLDDRLENPGAFAELPDGTLLASGSIGLNGGNGPRGLNRLVNGVWERFPGWTSETGFGMASVVSLPNGDVLVAGQFEQLALEGVSSNVVRWDGQNWRRVIDSFAGEQVRALEILPQGDIFAAGAFSRIDGRRTPNVALWNHATWSPVNISFDGEIMSLVVLDNGDLIAAGAFITSGATSSAHVARWDGVAWQPMGAGFDAPVLTLFQRGNGELIAGGQFTMSGTTPVSRIARWDGTAWQPLGPGVNAWVRALAEDSQGGLLVGGDFIAAGELSARRIARWDGTSWSTFSTGLSGLVGGIPAGVWSIAARPNGEIIVAGSFGRPTSPSQPLHAARWTGTEWVALSANPIPRFSHLRTLADGTVAIVSSGGGILRWDGTSVSPIAGSPITLPSCTMLAPDGDLLIGGNTATGVGVARWNGSAFTLLGSPESFNHRIQSMAVLPDSTIVAAGNFSTAGDYVSSYWARFGCDAAATILQQPGSLIVCSGGTAEFNTSALGPAPVRYTWRSNGEVIDQSTNASAGTSSLRLLTTSSGVNVIDCIVSTVAGATQTSAATLTISAGGACPAPCDSIDFNNNEVFPEDQDVIDFLSVLAGGECPACNDIDFNNNNVFPEDQDILDFFHVLAGGECS